ncbi:MAG: hypothetical protein ACPG8W_10165 [Candidatus Promineifilaceae bacterium]
MSRLIYKQIDTIEAQIEAQIEVSIDPYVCLDVSIDGLPSSNSTYYWRLIDPAFNVISFRVDSELGYILSIVISLYNGRFEETPQDGVHLRKEIPTTKGVPRFSQTGFSYVSNNDYIPARCDVVGRSRIFLSGLDMRVQLFPQEEDAFEVQLSNDLSFLFNSSKQLIAVLVSGLSDEDRASLHEFQRQV